MAEVSTSNGVSPMTWEEKFSALEVKFASLEKKYHSLHEIASTIAENSTGKSIESHILKVYRTTSEQNVIALEQC